METFGKFEILGVLGRGGMAEALKCRLPGIGGFSKTVVVKRILPSLVGEKDFLDMFLEEARIAANLSHPNVVQIFEIGEIDGTPYIEMEYVQGLTLSRVGRAAHKQKLVDLNCLARVFVDLAEGLHYVHTASGNDGVPLKLVHRDVSTSNVLVSLDGVPKLLDFGVAKANGRMVSTRVGVMKGKMRYMAPEQARGQQDLDARADVFSLAVCLHEVATRTSPFGKLIDEFSTIKTILEGPYLKPSTVVPDFPEELERIICWGMHPDREQRCPSAEQFGAALTQFCSRPSRAATRRDVATWVTTLSAFEPEQLLTATQHSTATPHSGVSSREEVNSIDLLIDSQPAVQPKRKWFIGAAVLAASIVVGGGLAVFFAGAPPKPVVAVAVAPATTPPAASPTSDDEAATTYVTEAERYLGEQKFEPALTLANKAKGLKVADPQLAIRLTAVVDQAEQGSLLQKGATLLRDGNPRGALDFAQRALDRAPGSAQALALQERAREKLASQAAPVVRKPAPTPVRVQPAPAAKEGRLTVSSEPPAQVSVDGENYGLAPISALSLPTGTHRVQFKLKGYATVETEVQVQTGKETSLVVPLVKEVARVEAPEPAKTEAAKPGDDKVAEGATGGGGGDAKPGKRKIPKPKLSPVYVASDLADLSRAFSIIEAQVVGTGLVTQSFARAMLGPLKGDLRAAETRIELYPSGIYYFVIREAMLNSDPEAAAESLRAFHRAGMRSFRTLPSEPGSP